MSLKIVSEANRLGSSTCKTLQEMTSVSVEDTLGKDARFHQLQILDPQCPDFVNSVVDNADGVFLWVFLVTQSLLDGLTNADRITDLQERLNETPKDLQEYFKTIVFSTESRYRTQTAQMLTIALNAGIALPLMAYWVINQEDPNYFFSCPTQTLSPEIRDSRIGNMRRRLRVLSRGLLEAENESLEDLQRADARMCMFEVTFLHRTVKDYLQSPEAHSMLQSWVTSTFNPDWECCKAFGTMVKMLPMKSSTPEGIHDVYVEHIFDCYARRIDRCPSFRIDLALLLEHIQAALTPTFEEKKDTVFHEMSQLYDDDYGMIWQCLEPDLVIVSACILFGIFNFISDRFAKEPNLCKRIVDHVPTLLLLLAGTGPFDERLPEEFLSTLKLLLAYGADPNRLLENGQTEWGFILRELVAERDGGRMTKEVKLRLFEAIPFLLQHGADFEAQITIEKTSYLGLDDPRSGGQHTESAKDVLRKLFDADQFGVLEDIVKQRDMKQKRNSSLSRNMGQLKLWVAAKKK